MRYAICCVFTYLQAVRTASGFIAFLRILPAVCSSPTYIAAVPTAGEFDGTFFACPMKVPKEKAPKAPPQGKAVGFAFRITPEEGPIRTPPTGEASPAPPPGVNWQHRRTPPVVSDGIKNRLVCCSPIIPYYTVTASAGTVKHGLKRAHNVRVFFVPRGHIAADLGKGTISAAERGITIF